MSARAKNPLYVVKGDKVEEANGLLDLVVKKLNLTPVIEFLNQILKILLESVTSYAAFVLVKDFVDMVVDKLELFKKFSII